MNSVTVCFARGTGAAFYPVPVKILNSFYSPFPSLRNTCSCLIHSVIVIIFNVLLLLSMIKFQTCYWLVMSREMRDSYFLTLQLMVHLSDHTVSFDL